MMVWVDPRCSVFKTKFHLWISTHETNVLNLPFLLNLVLKKPETHPDIILSSLNLNLLLFEAGENTFCIQCYFPHVWGVSVDARKNSGDKAIQSWERVDGNKVWGFGGFLVCLFNCGDTSFTQILEIRTYCLHWSVELFTHTIIRIATLNCVP